VVGDGELAMAMREKMQEKREVSGRENVCFFPFFCFSFFH
jgi:hypothetical protein